MYISIQEEFEEQIMKYVASITQNMKGSSISLISKQFARLGARGSVIVQNKKRRHIRAILKDSDTIIIG